MRVGPFPVPRSERSPSTQHNARSKEQIFVQMPVSLVPANGHAPFERSRAKLACQLFSSERTCRACRNGCRACCKDGRTRGTSFRLEHVALQAVRGCALLMTSFCRFLQDGWNMRRKLHKAAGAQVKWGRLLCSEPQERVWGEVCVRALRTPAEATL